MFTNLANYEAPPCRYIIERVRKNINQQTFHWGVCLPAATFGVEKHNLLSVISQI